MSAGAISAATSITTANRCVFANQRHQHRSLDPPPPPARHRRASQSTTTPNHAHHRSEPCQSLRRGAKSQFPLKGSAYHDRRVCPNLERRQAVRRTARCLSRLGNARFGGRDSHVFAAVTRENVPVTAANTYLLAEVVRQNVPFGVLTSRKRTRWRWWFVKTRLLAILIWEDAPVGGCDGCAPQAVRRTTRRTDGTVVSNPPPRP